VRDTKYPEPSRSEVIAADDDTDGCFRIREWSRFASPFVGYHFSFIN
jgi:hypothetical protein